MKKNYFLFGCLIFVVLAVLAFFIGLNLPGKKPAYTQPVKSDSWLVFNPSGFISDYKEVEYGFMGGTSSVEEICSKIRSAADDKNIRGILIRPLFTQISMAGVDEISAALQDFKKSKKPVLAHLEMQSQKDYLLAALADTIAMEPSAAAGVFLDGVRANITFYKELLDKLGLKINIIRSGQFKGFGEEYTRTSLSPETYGNIKEVLGDRYELLIKYIADRRKMSAEAVRNVFEQRQDYIVSPAYAKESGLVDALAGFDELLAQKNIRKKQLLKIEDYHPKPVTTMASDKIAVCYLQGGINLGSVSSAQEGITAEKVQKMITAIEEDKRIKAVVLRVDSPGGSALESEIIYRKLEQLKSKLPVVVSMSGTAASGGYYISSASDYIVADPFTVTGSIGVIQLLPDASGTSRKVGLSNQTIGFGKFPDAMNFMVPPSEELLASFQRNSESVYSEFKHRVAKYRKIDYDSLESLAGGRIWSAQDAREHRLVDAVGNLDTAVRKAAELAKLTSYKTVVLPERKHYFEIIMEQLKNYRLAQVSFHPETFKELLQEQLKSVFKPYTALCVMPFELE
jgi:protease-4